MSRPAPRRRAYVPDPDAPGRCCDMPGCEAMGAYKAPKSAHSLRDYWWFCLDHVRAYNATWDYCKGMTPAQIEQMLRADTAWGRPSWPLWRLGSAGWDEEFMRDPLHLLAEGRLKRGNPRAAAKTPPELREPLATLGLSWPTTLNAVKLRYKELAKRHHPDANGGDRAAEERFKDINLAYATLRTRLPAALAPA